MPNFELAQLLYQALAEPIGLVLRTSATDRARQQLYAARRLAADPDLDRLQIRVSPFPEGDLIICKGEAKVHQSNGAV